MNATQIALLKEIFGFKTSTVSSEGGWTFVFPGTRQAKAIQPLIDCGILVADTHPSGALKVTPMMKKK